MPNGTRYSVYHMPVLSSGLERILPHQLDDAGNRIVRPATGYAIEPTAPTSRRPHAPDAVAGPGVHRVARMVQEPSLQAAGPLRGARSAGQAGVASRTLRGYEKHFSHREDELAAWPRPREVQ